MKTTKFRCVSTHPEDLASGRVVAPGEEVELSEDDLHEDHNERLVFEGLLIPLEEGDTEAKKAAQRGRRDLTKQEKELADEKEGGK